MFGDLTATDLSPWDDLDFKVTYYGCLLSVTARLILASAIFLTIVLSNGSPWDEVQACHLASAECDWWARNRRWFPLWRTMRSYASASWRTARCIS
jgi:hypothetical protein